MELTTRFKRYATVVFLAGLGLLVTNSAYSTAAAKVSNGWTGDVPLEAPEPLRTL